MICHASERWRRFMEAVRTGATVYVNSKTWETLPDYYKERVHKSDLIPEDEIIAIDLKQYNPYQPIWTPASYSQSEVDEIIKRIVEKWK